jgi:hypothetical protein
VLIDFSGLEPPLLFLIAKGYMFDIVCNTTFLPDFVGIESFALPQLLCRLLLLI